jgi:hypothetical protein
MTRRLASALALILTALSAPLCRAQEAAEASKETSRAEVEQCVAQHDDARKARLGEQWLRARQAMHSCADERCPLAIAADCRAWLDELAGLMPTLIIVVEGERSGSSRATPRVEIDGASVALSDPPSPIELLPGPHRLRFEFPGERPATLDFTLEKGEKNHIERLRSTPPAHAASRVPTRPVPAASYWLSAGALAAFAGSAVLLTSGLNERADAQATCAPNCDTSIRTSIQTQLLLADIAAGAGLVLGGLAVYTYVRRPVVLSEPRPGGPKILANGQGISLVWRGEF